MTNLLKNEIRNKMKQERAKTPHAYRTIASNQICLRISTLECYQQATQIALYHAMTEEIDLTDLWHIACEDKKICYFPVLNDTGTLSFLPATPDTQFKKNKYGVLEPNVAKDLVIPIEQLDLIILPLLAFDFNCNRLGMGAGYYDRTLEQQSHSILLGAGYQFQRVNHLEADSWDIPLHGIVTQRAVYWRNTHI